MQTDCYDYYNIIIIKSVQFNNHLLNDRVNYVSGSQLFKHIRKRQREGKAGPSILEHKNGVG